MHLTALTSMLFISLNFASPLNTTTSHLANLKSADSTAYSPLEITIYFRSTPKCYYKDDNFDQQHKLHLDFDDPCKHTDRNLEFIRSFKWQLSDIGRHPENYGDCSIIYYADENCGWEELGRVERVNHEEVFRHESDKCISIPEARAFKLQCVQP